MPHVTKTPSKLLLSTSNNLMRLQCYQLTSFDKIAVQHTFNCKFLIKIPRVIRICLFNCPVTTTKFYQSYNRTSQLKQQQQQDQQQATESCSALTQLEWDMQNFAFSCEINARALFFFSFTFCGILQRG